MDVSYEAINESIESGYFMIIKTIVKYNILILSFNRKKSNIFIKILKKKRKKIEWLYSRLFENVL